MQCKEIQLRCCLTPLQTNSDWKKQKFLLNWKQFKESKRKLYELAQVVLAVSATQVDQAWREIFRL